MGGTAVDDADLSLCELKTNVVTMVVEQRATKVREALNRVLDFGWVGLYAKPLTGWV